MAQCESCRRITTRDRGEAPPWDNIYRSPYWDVVHAYNCAHLGWLVLVCRRHIEAIDEMTRAEAHDLGDLLRVASRALKLRLGCEKTYVMQFAEASDHRHVHFHLVARMRQQPPEDKSWRIFRHLGVPVEQRCSETAMNALAADVGAHLLAEAPGGSTATEAQEQR